MPLHNSSSIHFGVILPPFSSIADPVVLDSVLTHNYAFENETKGEASTPDGSFKGKPKAKS